MIHKIVRRVTTTVLAVLGVCHAAVVAAAPGVHYNVPLLILEQTIVSTDGQITREGNAMIAPGVHR